MHRKQISQQVTAFLVLFMGVAIAGESGNHYTNGVEGVDVATVPPPGVYIRNYSLYYNAGTLKDGTGQDSAVGFKAKIWAEVPRLIYITPKKLLGGNIGFDALVPILNTDLSIKAANVHQSSTAVGDMLFSPMILSWHGKRYDAAAAVGFFAPTGKWSATDSSSAGKNYWTTMVTGGGTVYLDEPRRWSASLLARYEVHTTRRDIDAKLGNDFHFEWGFANAITKTVQLGVAGYQQFQVTQDKGTAVTWDASVKDRVSAIGPEISVKIPSAMFFISLRGLVEYAAKDRPEGTMVVLTLTKRF